MPRPISATRNSTIIETSVIELTPHRTRNVVMIETIAIRIGTNASSEANTKASTTSAPKRLVERRLELLEPGSDLRRVHRRPLRQRYHRHDGRVAAAAVVQGQDPAVGHKALASGVRELLAERAG